MRIAMWSGPRNLSTAMMYSFGNRADFAVWDEPFYSAYLQASDSDHPMKTEVIEAGESDPKQVSSACIDSILDDKQHFYMKHMSHHMLPDFPLDWAHQCTNIHLIRHPARVIASYTAKRQEATLQDIGFAQQVAIYGHLGGVVIDSSSIRRDPERALKRLCEAINLPFDPAMLQWPAGGHINDGVWARHWYGAVHQSAGFAGPEDDLPQLTGWAADLLAQAMPYYDEMKAAAEG